MNQLQSTGQWRGAAELQPNDYAHYLTNGQPPQNEESQSSDKSLVVIVDKRALESECLARGLLEHDPALNISAVGSLDEFQKLPSESEASAVLVVLGARKLTDQTVRAELTQFVSDVDGIPVIVVADCDEPAEI